MTKAVTVKRNHWIAYERLLFGIPSRDGCRLGSSPGAGLNDTSIGRGGGARPVSRFHRPASDGSATIVPSTSPPFHAGLKRGAWETPMSATKPGPSTPLLHSARKRAPPVPEADWPPTTRQRTTCRQKALARRKSSLSSATPTLGSAIGGSLEFCS